MRWLRDTTARAALAILVAGGLVPLTGGPALAQSMCMGMGMSCNPQWAPSGPTPVFNFNSESDGSINTSLAGYSFARASTATTCTESGGDYTLSETATGTPRYAECPATSGAGAYLVEGAGTNLIVQSEDLSTSWTADDITISSATGPDGASHSIAITSTGGTTVHGVRQNPVTVATGENTISLFGSAQNLDWVQILFNCGGSNARRWFDLANQTVGGDLSDPPSGASRFVDAGPYIEGFYRVAVTHNCSSTSLNLIVRAADADEAATYAATGVVDIEVFGIQVEAGSVATSYIPTTTMSASRAADVLTYDYTNQQEGSLVVEVTPIIPDTSTQVFADLYDNAQNRALLYATNSSGMKPAYFSEDGSVTQWNIVGGTDLTAGARIALSGSFETDNIEGFVDGVSIGTDTSANVDAGADEVHIGHENGSFIAPGYYHCVQTFNTLGVKECQ